MPIVSSEIVGQVNKPNGRRKLLMQATDHTGKIWERRPNVPEDNIDSETLAAWVVDLTTKLPDYEVQAEIERAKNALTPDPQHQTKTELYKKTINLLMQIEDSLEFSETLQYFRDFEVDADTGANTNARAAYLGISNTEYALVTERYNQITGVKSGLEADALRVADGDKW